MISTLFITVDVSIIIVMIYYQIMSHLLSLMIAVNITDSEAGIIQLNDRELIHFNAF